MVRFSSASDVSEWGQYDIEEIPLLQDGEETKYKAILQNGELAQISSMKYTVLPNEEAVKIAEQAAKEVGMVPFHEFSGEWFVRMESNVIKDGWKIHALYAINEPYEVNGDKMHLGVGIHNSIDGRMGFGAGIFTFRHACANMVLAGSRRYTQSFDERATIDYIYQRHQGDFDDVMGDLTYKITSLMDKAVGIIESYNHLAKIKLDDEYRKDFLKRMKRSTLPSKWLPPYLRVKDEQTLLPLAKELTVWDAYNDITANIWHDQGKASLGRRILAFDHLHKLIPLQVSK